jgi:Mlc titration factor MtfA (ptsG expression regulator)
MTFQVLTFLLSALIVLFLLYILVKPLFRGSKRKRLLGRPFPLEWEEILEHNVALYRYLPEPLKKELKGHIKVFLGEKNFEGCGGLEITDEIRVTIAGQACILLLNRVKPTYYPTLYSILVYPSAYVAKQVTAEGMQHTEEMSVRGGESWTRGEVVLAWDFVRKAAIDLSFGHNVVLHEFAHQLDQEDGRADGAPILRKSTSYKTWAHVLSHDYEGLRRDALSGRKDIMDAYGATNPAEFFAVATETFFEKPKQMKLSHPELYEELKSYYGLEPLKWFEEGGRPADNSAK